MSASSTAAHVPPDASVPGAQRPGMVFVPAGTLRAGTAADRTPRVADEELPGESVELGAFYIDVLPFPNEPGAIATSNVSREEAEQLCAGKGKRLCSELEWERACKGPENATYEYGDAYKPAACGTGIVGEQAAKRPTGEHPQCKSGFGVADMHGGAWEWTSSAWGRGAPATLGVLRGGNATAGELVGRCANAIGRAPTKKAPTMGLRCCAGPKNAVEVGLTLKGSPGLTFTSTEIPNALRADLERTIGKETRVARAWAWWPVGNEELDVVLACGAVKRVCTFLVARRTADGPKVVAEVEVGRELPELARVGDPRHLRLRGFDPRGSYNRDITYIYGRVDVGELRRP